MRRVDFTLNGRSHSLNCEAGQERRVSELAAYVDARMKEITGGGGGNDVQNLLLTSLVLADELQEARAELLRRGSAAAAPVPAATPAHDDTVVVAAVDGLAKRIEDIAARLERT